MKDFKRKARLDSTNGRNPVVIIVDEFTTWRPESVQQSPASTTSGQANEGAGFYGASKMLPVEPQELTQ